MARITVLAIVEGQTENVFLTKLLGSHLALKGIDFHCPIVWLGEGRGGVKGLKCEDFCDQVRRHLQDGRQPYVTTFFDYYGLPISEKHGWDFVKQAKDGAKSHTIDIAVERIHEELHRMATCDLKIVKATTRFFPYIQLHELEALFFAEPEKLAELFENTNLAAQFKKAVVDCKECELINDRPQYAPSKRIETAFPFYMKGRSALAHAPRLADRLSLETVRMKCPRFSSWVSKLENLTNTAEL